MVAEKKVEKWQFSDKFGRILRCKSSFSVCNTLLQLGILQLTVFVYGIDYRFVCVALKQFEAPAKKGEWEADWEIGTSKEWAVGNYTCGISELIIYRGQCYYMKLNIL